MKERIEKLLANAGAISKRDAVTIQEIKDVYALISGKAIEDCPKCIPKAVTAIQKYYYLNFEKMEDNENGERKYVLKPGNHAFAPGTSAVHNNDNTDDDAAAFYLKAYPHIKALFEKLPAKD